MSHYAISYADVEQAHKRIAAIVHHTPVLTSRTADHATGAQIFFKCENFQRAGAFKVRGAYNALAQFTPEQGAKGVVAFSSGNHAQGVALAAQLLKMRAVIVMPEDCAAIKVAATRAYGAEVVLYDRYTEDREAIGQRLAQEQGLTLIPPYDHPYIMAGQGTAVKELIEEVGTLDELYVPLGGGGLLSGSAIVANAVSPGCRVFGVEPAAGNDGQQSFRSGSIVHIETPRTIADGAQSQHLGQLTFPVIHGLVEDILTVSDADLVKTMQFFAERMKMLVEPTACLSATAAMRERDSLRGKKIGVVLTGGNIDLLRFAELVQQAAK